MKMKLSRIYRNHMNESILLKIHSPAIINAVAAVDCLSKNLNQNSINNNNSGSNWIRCLCNSMRTKQLIKNNGQIQNQQQDSSEYRCKISIQRLDRFDWFLLRPLLCFLLVLSLIFYLFYNWIQSRLFWSFVAIILFSLFMYFFSPVKEESLILLDNFGGFEYERRYLCGTKRSTFINTNCIMINEAITMQRVIFYLVAIPFCLKSFVEYDDGEDNGGENDPMEYCNNGEGPHSSRSHNHRSQSSSNHRSQSSTSFNSNSSNLLAPTSASVTPSPPLYPPPTPPPTQQLYRQHHYQHQMSPNHQHQNPEHYPQQASPTAPVSQIPDQTKLIPLFTGTMPRLDCLKLIYQQIVKFRQLRNSPNVLSNSISNQCEPANGQTTTILTRLEDFGGGGDDQLNQPNQTLIEDQRESKQSTKHDNKQQSSLKNLRIRKNGFLR